MIRLPPRSTLDRSSAASDVYKRQAGTYRGDVQKLVDAAQDALYASKVLAYAQGASLLLSLIHISEPTRPY